MTDDLLNALESIDSDALPSDDPNDEIVWSHYQRAVFDFVENGEGNAIVEAVAGSGKTSTIVEALNYTPTNSKVAFVAFNKHIADELSRRVHLPHVHISTLHSLGLKNLTSHVGHVKVDAKKIWLLLDDYSKSKHWSDGEVLKQFGGTVKELLSLSKAWLLEPTDNNLDYLSDRYGIHTNGNETTIYQAVRALHNRSFDALDRWVDFDDMIYATAIGYCPAQQFDFIFCDELQDVNRAQTEFILKATHENTRIIGVGDVSQAIYGFAGSDTEAMDYFKQRTNAIELPLSITYRCPTSVVSLAQQIVPHIEPRPDAPEGKVHYILDTDLTAHVQEGDFVICRVNAPLIAPAFHLIRSGTKAVVLGRDIGKGLQNLIRLVQKRSSIYNLTPFLRELVSYRDSEVVKLMSAKKESRAASLDDQTNTIIALASQCETISDLNVRIAEVFNDERQGVTFSSIHKAKGLEAERVFILLPEIIPHKMSRQSWQLEQEYNLKYVAITRAKSELFFVQGTEG